MVLTGCCFGGRDLAGLRDNRKQMRNRPEPNILKKYLIFGIMGFRSIGH